MMKRSKRAAVQASIAGAAALGVMAAAGTGVASAAAHPVTPLKITNAELRAAVARAQTRHSAAAARAAGVVKAAAALGVPGVKLTAITLAAGVKVGEWTALSPNGKTLYVSENELLGSGGAGVIAIDLSAPTSIPKEITDGGKALTDATSLAISPNGKTLYIGDASSSTSDADAVFTANVGGGSTNDTVVGAVTSGSMEMEPFGMTISPNGKDLYLSGLTASASSPEPAFGIAAAKLTTATKGTVTSSIAAPKVGLAVALTMNPNGKVVYGSDIIGPGSAISVSGAIVKSATTLPEVYGTMGIAVSPDGRTLYASPFSILGLESAEFVGESEVDTYALSTGGTTATLVRSTVTSGSAMGIDLNPSGSKAYAPTETYDASTSTEVTGLSTFTVPAAISGASISGAAKPGGTLSAKGKGAGGATDTYKWMANGKTIKGATGSKLVVSSKLAGEKVSVTVTGTAVGYHRSSATSKAVTVS